MSSASKLAEEGKGYMIRKKGTEEYSQGGTPGSYFSRLKGGKDGPPFGPKGSGKVWTAGALGSHLAQYFETTYSSVGPSVAELKIPTDWEIVPVEVCIIETGDPVNAREYVKAGRAHKAKVKKLRERGYEVKE